MLLMAAVQRHVLRKTLCHNFCFRFIKLIPKNPAVIILVNFHEHSIAPLSHWHQQLLVAICAHMRKQNSLAVRRQQHGHLSLLRIRQAQCAYLIRKSDSVASTIDIIRIDKNTELNSDRKVVLVILYESAWYKTGCREVPALNEVELRNLYC